MTMELFRKPLTPSFEKTAAKHILSDNPATWISELTAALYKQHDWLGKYQVDVQIESQDDSLGYLYGMFLISPASDVPRPALNVIQAGPSSAEAAPPAEQQPQVRIPIIVAEKKAYSFDVFISLDNKFLPLSEERAATQLYDAGAFSTAPRTALEGAVRQTEDDNFSPGAPTRAFGGSVQSTFGASQGAVKTSSVLEMIQPDVTAVEAFLEKIASDEVLVSVAKQSPYFAHSLRKLASLATEAPARLNEGADAATTPALLQKIDGGFLLKVASGGEMHSQGFTNAEASVLPLAHRQVAITHGVTLLNAASSPLPLFVDTSRVKTASVSGAYSVINKTGGVEDAIVLTDLVAFDGRDLDQVLVLGSTGNGFQEKIAGIQIHDTDLAKLPSLTGSPVRGSGFFWFPKLAAASEPIEIVRQVRGGADVYWDVAHPLYGAAVLTKTSTARPIYHQTSDRQYFLIPDDALFIPFEKTASYVEDEFTARANSFVGLMDKTASLVSDGSRFSFEGSIPFELEDHLDLSDALLALGRLGDSGAGAREKLASAALGNRVNFYVNPIEDARFVEDATAPEEHRKFASYCQAELTKEAAALASSTGQDTVDSILSLNFITPENVQGYFEAMPELEVAVTKLAELLVGVRLGLQDVSEVAVTSAVTGIERTLQGLKKLQMRQDYNNRQ